MPNSIGLLYDKSERSKAFYLFRASKECRVENDVLSNMADIIEYGKESANKRHLLTINTHCVRSYRLT